MDVYNLSAASTSRKSMINLNATEALNSSIRLQDCTVYSRVGFRGTGVEDFLTSKGVPIPALPNQSVVHDGSLMVLRLSQSEFWVVDMNNTHNQQIESLELASQGLSNLYRLFCQHSHACFSVVGKDTATLFSKVCGVDLREPAFSLGDIAQTSVARINTIVAKQNINEEDGLLLFADLASAQYLWEALADAAAEFSSK